MIKEQNNLLENVLHEKGFWMINKCLAQKIGFLPTLLLTHLIDKRKYHKKNNELINGYFYNTQDDIEKSTMITIKQQRKIVKDLENSGFLKVKFMKYKTDSSPRKYFKIHDKEIIEYLTKEEENTIRPLQKGRDEPYLLGSDEPDFSATTIYTNNKYTNNKRMNRQSEDCQEKNFPTGKCSEPTGSPSQRKEILGRGNKDSFKKGENSARPLKYMKFLQKYKPIIDTWNSLRADGCWTSIHKISDNSSTINSIIKYLKQLEEGNFGNRCDIDKEWAKRCKVNHTLSHKKWTEKEIIAIILSYKKCFKDGYMNGNKEKYLPKSFKDFLYKEYGNTSWFLKIASTPPKSNAEIITAKPKDEEIYLKYRNLFNGSIKTPNQEQNLILKVNDIIEEVEKIQQSPGKLYKHTGFDAYFGTYVFHSTYIDWLKKRKKVIPEFIGVNGMLWKYFVDFASDYHHFYLYPNENQLKDMQWDADRVARDMKFYESQKKSKRNLEHYL